ncbi:MAG: hypothetical protein KatS3mg043_1801 [Rhodothermaceae bacterium]|nr:MAG: hypothetical protein KatS3mg043_1801 [Rhodothermaceae bacterium]
MLRSVVFLTGWLILVLPGRAQPLSILSTDPAEGQAGVPLAKVVVFNLSKPLPQFGSVFVKRFTWSPTDSTRLTVFGHDQDEDGKLTVVFFTLQHTPGTDFSFFVYGVKAADGSTMERPFALNYSTATEMGTRRVSGTVAIAAGTATRTSAKRARLQQVVWEVLEAQAEQLERAVWAGAAPYVPAKTVARPKTGTTGELDLDKTVVLLLDRYVVDRRSWRIHAAAAIQEDATFTFNHVRDGTYWPLAINWDDEEGEVVAAYGFYDADGDLEPDPITVSGGDVTDLGVVLEEISVGTEPDPASPRPFTLHPNFPNPFSPPTEITFDVGRPGPVRLTVYDLLGRTVRTLVDGFRPAGRHRASWDGRNEAGDAVAGGVYLYRLEAGGHTEGRLMTLVR